MDKAATTLPLVTLDARSGGNAPAVRSPLWRLAHHPKQALGRWTTIAIAASALAHILLVILVAGSLFGGRADTTPRPEDDAIEVVFAPPVSLQPVVPADRVTNIPAPGILTDVREAAVGGGELTPSGERPVDRPLTENGNLPEAPLPAEVAEAGGARAELGATPTPGAAGEVVNPAAGAPPVELPEVANVTENLPDGAERTDLPAGAPGEAPGVASGAAAADERIAAGVPGVGPVFRETAPSVVAENPGAEVALRLAPQAGTAADGTRRETATVAGQNPGGEIAPPVVTTPEEPTLPPGAPAASNDRAELVAVPAPAPEAGADPAPPAIGAPPVEVPRVTIGPEEGIGGAAERMQAGPAAVADVPGVAVEAPGAEERIAAVVPAPDPVLPPAIPGVPAVNPAEEVAIPLPAEPPVATNGTRPETAIEPAQNPVGEITAPPDVAPIGEQPAQPPAAITANVDRGALEAPAANPVDPVRLEPGRPNPAEEVLAPTAPILPVNGARDDPPAEPVAPVEIAARQDQATIAEIARPEPVATLPAAPDAAGNRAPLPDLPVVDPAAPRAGETAMAVPAEVDPVMAAAPVAELPAQPVAAVTAANNAAPVGAEQTRPLQTEPGPADVAVPPAELALRQDLVDPVPPAPVLPGAFNPPPPTNVDTPAPADTLAAVVAPTPVPAGAVLRGEEIQARADRGTDPARPAAVADAGVPAPAGRETAAVPAEGGVVAPVTAERIGADETPALPRTQTAPQVVVLPGATTVVVETAPPQPVTEMAAVAVAADPLPNAVGAIVPSPVTRVPEATIRVPIETIAARPDPATGNVRTEPAEAAIGAAPAEVAEAPAAPTLDAAPRQAPAVPASAQVGAPQPAQIQQAAGPAAVGARVEAAPVGNTANVVADPVAPLAPAGPVPPATGGAVALAANVVATPVEAAPAAGAVGAAVATPQIAPATATAAAPVGAEVPQTQTAAVDTPRTAPATATVATAPAGAEAPRRQTAAVATAQTAPATATLAAGPAGAEAPRAQTAAVVPGFQGLGGEAVVPTAGAAAVDAALQAVPATAGALPPPAADRQPVEVAAVRNTFDIGATVAAVVDRMACASVMAVTDADRGTVRLQGFVSTKPLFETELTAAWQAYPLDFEDVQLIPDPFCGVFQLLAEPQFQLEPEPRFYFMRGPANQQPPRFPNPYEYTTMLNPPVAAANYTVCLISTDGDIQCNNTEAGYRAGDPVPIRRTVTATDYDVIMVLWIFSEQPLLGPGVEWIFNRSREMMMWTSRVPALINELRNAIANLPAGAATYGYDLFRVGTGPG